MKKKKWRTVIVSYMVLYLRVRAFHTLKQNSLCSIQCRGGTEGSREIEVLLVDPSKRERVKCISGTISFLVLKDHHMK